MIEWVNGPAHLHRNGLCLALCMRSHTPCFKVFEETVPGTRGAKAKKNNKKGMHTTESLLLVLPVVPSAVCPPDMSDIT